jgi:hypothetical protein
MLRGDSFPLSSRRVEEIRSTVTFDNLLIVAETIIRSATKPSAPRSVLLLDF